MKIQNLGSTLKCLRHRTNIYSSFCKYTLLGFNQIPRRTPILTKIRTLFCPDVAYTKMEMRTIIILGVPALRQISKFILFPKNKNKTWVNILSLKSSYIMHHINNRKWKIAIKVLFFLHLILFKYHLFIFKNQQQIIGLLQIFFYHIIIIIAHNHSSFHHKIGLQI